MSSHQIPDSSAHVRGHAEGWSVYQETSGRWRWSAYGPRGGSMGTADNEMQAHGLARRALESLRRVRPLGFENPRTP